MRQFVSSVNVCGISNFPKSSHVIVVKASNRLKSAPATAAATGSSGVLLAFVGKGGFPVVDCIGKVSIILFSDSFHAFPDDKLARCRRGVENRSLGRGFIERQPCRVSSRDDSIKRRHGLPIRAGMAGRGEHGSKESGGDNSGSHHGDGVPLSWSGPCARPAR
jgi:hypothetical protein